MTQRMARHVKIAFFLPSLDDITLVFAITLSQRVTEEIKPGCQALRKCRGQGVVDLHKRCCLKAGPPSATLAQYYTLSYNMSFIIKYPDVSDDRTDI